MLTAKYLDTLPDPILELFEEYQQSVINDIARRLAKSDMTSTAAWQMQRLTESGRVYDTALEEISKLTGRSESELARLFERAGVKSMQFDDSVYRAAGLNPLPLNLSPAMAQTLAAGLQKTQGVMRNLTMSTALTGQEAYIHAADLAYMQVTSGAFTYQDAIKQAIKTTAKDGLDVINYASGRKDKIDVALRRTILTGVSQTAAQLQERRADEMGVDLVQTSAHIGARNIGAGAVNHQSWQGKIFSRSGSHKKYPDFKKETGYGTGPGLCGYNCRHSFYPFFEGISENAYKQADLDSFANKKVQYNNKTMSVYEATQKQRAIERDIREAKRQAGALQAAGIDNTEEMQELRHLQLKMSDFTDQTGLQRQRFREQVFAGPGSKLKTVRTAPRNRVSKAPRVEVAEPVTQGPRKTPRDLVVEHGHINNMISEIEPGFNAINQVHAVDGMPKFLLSDGEGVPLPQKSKGLYAPNAVKSANPQDPSDLIICRPTAEDKPATFVHEYGHMVDHRGFGTGDMYGSQRAATMNEGPMVEWWKAVQETPEYKKLRVMTENPSAHAWIEEDSTGRYRVTPDSKFTAYLSEPDELWARAYAQYIGNNTGHRYNFEGIDQHYPFAWSDDSFGPIADAIDTLFKSKGWK